MLSGGGDGGNREENPEAGHFSGLKAVKVSYLPADLHEIILLHLLWSRDLSEGSVWSSSGLIFLKKGNF